MLLVQLQHPLHPCTMIDEVRAVQQAIVKIVLGRGSGPGTATITVVVAVLSFLRYVGCSLIKPLFCLHYYTLEADSGHPLGYPVDNGR